MVYIQAFWDYIEKKKLGAARAELSVTSEWSPNGQYFMTARTAPRLQVDNGASAKICSTQFRARCFQPFCTNVCCLSPTSCRSSCCSSDKVIWRKPCWVSVNVSSASSLLIFVSDVPFCVNFRESSKDAMENMKNRLKQREKKAVECGAKLIPIETIRSNDHGESIPGLPFQEKEHYSVVVEDDNILVKLDN